MAGAFFAQSRQPGATVQLTIDGKTLRGNRGGGASCGGAPARRAKGKRTAAPRLLETNAGQSGSGDAIL